ncbi:MAG TPA: AAA family ATPase [Candidatus Binataceae bacterium]|nr:AAA family ATPase [Candidatus Binataceae bacterium]
MGHSGTVTLLFTDLVDSTEHLQRAGDEAGEQLFRLHHRFMTEAVVGGGGEELEWLGDGMLAAFSSSADAVRCAISMQQTARRTTGGSRIEIRIGIHLGEVLRRDGGYFGTPVVTARRLCDRASSGQILCSRLIAELLASRQTFGFRDLGKLELKGLAEPVGVCEVVFDRNDPAVMLNRTPFVGRAGQLKRLSAKLEEACNGRGSIAMLRGEPGIGKTRTIEEFADLAKQRGAVVLRGACYEGEWQAPYGPFAEAILDYASQADRAELAGALGKGASIIARVAPALRELVPNIPEPVPLDKEEERFRVFDAVAQFLIAASQRTPLVLVLDDLHWADLGMVAMLSHLAHFVPANPILLIGAYRDAEVDRKHPLAGALASIGRLRNFENLQLEGLKSEEVGELLGIIGDQDAPDTLVKALDAATEGNPLFIREVLLHLVEEGKILREGQGWASKLSVEELGIPEGVRQVISRRLLRLSEDANRLLAVASAFNGPFSFEVAAAAAGLDESAALGAIDEALDVQLLRPGSNSETFDFRHAIIRNTLYSQLNPARRVRLHRKIAEEMERAWGERIAHHAAEVAFQFWRGAAASGTERGADYAIAAADNAEAAYAHDETAAFLRIALELIPQNDSRRARLTARLGAAMTWTLDGDDAAEVALKAAKLIASVEGEESAADYCESTARQMVRGGLMRSAWVMAEEGLRHIGSRRDIVWASLDEIDLSRCEAEAPDNPGITIDSERRRQRRAVLKGISSEHAKAWRIDEYPYDSREEIIRDPHCDGLALLFLAGECRRSLPLWQERAVDAERSGRLVVAMDAWAHVARCHNALGEFTEAQAAYDRAIAFSARINRPSLPLLNLISVRTDFFIALDRGAGEIVIVPGLDQLMADPLPVFKFVAAASFGTRALAMAQKNQAEPAMRALGTLQDALRRGAPWGAAYNLMACDAASTLWLLGRTEYVELIEQSIREKVLVPDFRFPMRDGRLSMARLSALQGRCDEAADWFKKAREVFDEQGFRPLRAIADYDEALMYLRRGLAGDAQRAQPFLDAAVSQFRTLGMTGWIKRAAARIRADASPGGRQDAVAR